MRRAEVASRVRRCSGVAPLRRGLPARPWRLDAGRRGCRSPGESGCPPAMRTGRISGGPRSAPVCDALRHARGSVPDEQPARACVGAENMRTVACRWDGSAGVPGMCVDIRAWAYSRRPFKSCTRQRPGHHRGWMRPVRIAQAAARVLNRWASPRTGARIGRPPLTGRCRGRKSFRADRARRPRRDGGRLRQPRTGSAGRRRWHGRRPRHGRRPPRSPTGLAGHLAVPAG